MNKKFAAEKKYTTSTGKTRWFYTTGVSLWLIQAIAVAALFWNLEPGGNNPAVPVWVFSNQFLLTVILLLSLLTLGALISCIQAWQRSDKERLRAQYQAENYLKIARSIVISLDTSGHITLINRAGRKILGFRSREIIGKNWIGMLVPSHHRQKAQSLFNKMIKGEIAPIRHLENFEILARDGTKRLTSWRNILIKNERGDITGTLSSGEDITHRVLSEEKLRKNKQRLKRLAHHDFLTKLPNRLLFHDRLRHAIAQAERTQEQVALLLLDLDRFKNINDTLGHHVGDQFLKVVASRLRTCVREGDTVARLGGDEFVVVLQKIQSLRDAKVVAEKLLDDLARPISVENNELNVTTSIGISLYPSGGRSVEELVRTADTAMYQAKEHGRNNYQFYTEDMSAKALEWLAFEGDLRQALKNDQLVIHYQPQYDLKKGALMGLQVWLHWQHPERGLLEPGVFIPFAEESGQIIGIGEWMLRQVCTQNALWQAQGYSPVKLSIKLSNRQFHQRNLVGAVKNILQETKLDGKHLEFELQEKIITEDVAAAISTLIELRRLGISLVIDAFGMGTTSLSYLQRFPLDKLKISRSIVQKISKDVKEATITAATIALAHHMGMQVVAESVENRIQANFLIKRGCDEVRGHLYSKPMPADECRYLLTKERS